MNCTCFEELYIWQEARLVVREIYEVMRNCKDYGFRDQFQRAAVSIMNNIAEGFERSSDKDFSLFLKYASGSCGEVRSMSYLAEDFSYLSPAQAESLRSRCHKISARNQYPAQISQSITWVIRLPDFSTRRLVNLSTRGLSDSSTRGLANSWTSRLSDSSTL